MPKVETLFHRNCWVFGGLETNANIYVHQTQNSRRVLLASKLYSHRLLDWRQQLQIISGENLCTVGYTTTTTGCSHESVVVTYHHCAFQSNGSYSAFFVIVQVDKPVLLISRCQSIPRKSNESHKDKSGTKESKDSNCYTPICV